MFSTLERFLEFLFILFSLKMGTKKIKKMMSHGIKDKNSENFWGGTNFVNLFVEVFFFVLFVTNYLYTVVKLYV